jgi:uncharacterized protein (DUF849 family)
MLIKACLNGGTTRDEHPSVPQQPAELAAAAAEAVQAGAGAVHLHPRDASGAETLAPEAGLAAVAAVRAHRGRALDRHHDPARRPPASGNGELVQAAVNLVAELSPPA